MEFISSKTLKICKFMVVSPCCINVCTSTSVEDLFSFSTMSTSTQSPSSPGQQKVRSEDELGKKLERCAADSLLKIGGGLAVGIIFSVVLFKRRSWPIWFGTGVGAGMGYSNCQHDIREPYLLHGRKIKASEVAKEKLQPTDYLVVFSKPQSDTK